MNRRLALFALGLFVLCALGKPAWAVDYITSTSCTVSGASACNVNGCFVCNGTTWVPQALIVGAASTCDAAHAGLLQWTGSAFQGCDGTMWLTVANRYSGVGSIVNPWVYNNGTYTSCYSILQSGANTGSGVYTITLLSGMTNVYCDMTTDGGGWTFVVGISGSNANHINTNAVTPTNLTSTSGLGKLADSDINGLKSGTNPAFRLTCASTTGYFQTGCNFTSTTTASGTCVAVSYTYGGSYSGSNSQTGADGLADGISTPANRLIYGSPSYNGCDTASSVWSNRGTLWVR